MKIDGVPRFNYKDRRFNLLWKFLENKTPAEGKEPTKKDLACQGGEYDDRVKENGGIGHEGHCYEDKIGVVLCPHCEGVVGHYSEYIDPLEFSASGAVNTSLFIIALCPLCNGRLTIKS